MDDAVELLTWAIIECDSRKPDMKKIRKALEQAVIKVAKTELKLAASRENFIRLSHASGEIKLP